LVRRLGSFNRTEPKNRTLFLRVTAREYAKTRQLANFTNHTVSDLIRKGLNDLLASHAKDLEIINCTASYQSSIPFKMNNIIYNNNKKRRSWFKPKPILSDKLQYKKSIGSDIPELEINPLTDQPPLIIQDHTEDELFKVYENVSITPNQTNHIDSKK
jgi:hypothetical protein